MESLRPYGIDFDVLFVNGRESRWNYVRGLRQLHRQLKLGRYDLIHAHFGLSGWVARAQMRLPVVVSFMGDDVLGQPRADGSITLTGRFFQTSSFVLARLADVVIVKSREMQSRLRLPSARVIPNGVDLDLFRPMEQQEARRRLGIGLEKKLVIFPYDPNEPRKRYDVIEAAVERARREVPTLEILVARGVPRTRMPLYLNAADVFVMASLLEGSPNALKESMAVNLPVITVEAGDAAELIGPTAGCHIVPRDPEAMAEKIVEVCRAGQRTEGRNWISRLSMEVVAGQIAEVYTQALGRG